MRALDKLTEVTQDDILKKAEKQQHKEDAKKPQKVDLG